MTSLNAVILEKCKPLTANIKLSIRSYNQTQRSHAHTHCQLVLPIHGQISMSIDDESAIIGPKQCAVIYADEVHSFSAKEAAQFLVADLPTLPNHFLVNKQHYITISDAFYAFVQYAEKQLAQAEYQSIAEQLTALFWQLLSIQVHNHRIDKRIVQAINYMETHLAKDITLSELASLACLSVSQFKSVFKRELSTTPKRYLTTLRMEKAKALLSYSDYPISIISEKVGYCDTSAFSRRFHAHFGQNPRAFTEKR